MFDYKRLLRLVRILIEIPVMLQRCSMSFPDYPVVTVPEGRHAQEKDFIAAAISPITQKDENKKYFYVDMHAKNILPVHVLVKNEGNKRSLILDREKIFLEGSESYDHKKVAESSAGKTFIAAGLAALATDTSYSEQPDRVSIYSTATASLAPHLYRTGLIGNFVS